MSQKITLEELNKNYIYKTDQNQFGRAEHWKVMKPNEKGQFVGDCEDYCLTLQKLIPQFKEWDLYFCKTNGNGHCILYKNGDVIDCNTQKIVSFEQYCKMYKVTEFKKYNWFVVLSKILFSNMHLLYRKTRGI